MSVTSQIGKGIWKRSPDGHGTPPATAGAKIGLAAEYVEAVLTAMARGFHGGAGNRSRTVRSAPTPVGMADGKNFRLIRQR